MVTMIVLVKVSAKLFCPGKRWSTLSNLIKYLPTRTLFVFPFYYLQSPINATTVRLQTRH